MIEYRINEHGGAYRLRVHEGIDGRYVFRCVDWYGPHLWDLSLRDPLREATWRS